MLRVEGLCAGYGSARIVHNVSLEVAAGEIVCLLGRNGAGKTTTLSAIAGAIPLFAGEVRLGGKAIVPGRADVVSRHGLKLVPEHRGIFAMLTVEENLRIAARRDSICHLTRCMRCFPVCASAEKMAGRPSRAASNRCSPSHVRW